MSVSASTVQGGLRRVLGELRRACARAGRAEDAARLVAVSKRQPVADIRAALAEGQRDFGENYAQELRDKARDLADEPALRWHYIGPLQRNKTKYVVGIAALVHAVDSAKLLHAIEARAAALGVVQDVLIQVNLAGEDRKSGLAEDELQPLAAEFAETPHVRLRGLMLMPPWDPDPEAARPLFRRLAALRDELASAEAVELSMGMSHDFHVAVEEGATLVRVGTAIFGERQSPQ
ncbi:MAG: YggS family pyridoxal phosphate-dependent enzyme [bacterium]